MTLMDRDVVASRLLRRSAVDSHDPVTEIDWDAPLDPTLPAMPLHRVSLYGTPLWEDMPKAQRVQLSWHELASCMSVGLWFEIILMQALLRYAYDRNPHEPHTQYALTEVGDETRHAVMFARASEKLAPGARYRPHPRVHQLGRLFKTVSAGPSLFASVLVAEETLDRLQREGMADPALLPLAREVCRIHVTEEARHVAYARTAVERQVPRLNRAELGWHRLVTAVTSVFVVESFLDPAVYTNVGLDRDVAVAQAKANPFAHASRVWSAERVIRFLSDADLIAGPSTRVWERAHLLAA